MINKIKKFFCNEKMKQFNSRNAAWLAYINKEIVADEKFLILGKMHKVDSINLKLIEYNWETKIWR